MAFRSKITCVSLCCKNTKIRLILHTDSGRKIFGGFAIQANGGLLHEVSDAKMLVTNGCTSVLSYGLDDNLSFATLSDIRPEWRKNAINTDT